MEPYVVSGSDGASLYGMSWLPEGRPRAVIQFVHGVGEHTACYHQWAQGFCRDGFACIGMDHRGHGKSAGRRGHTSVSSFEQDMEVALKHTRALFGTIPLFLYGHSMGGAFALWFAGRHSSWPVSGVIASSPMLQLARPPHPFWVYHSALLAKIIPSFTLKTGISKKDLFSDDSEVKSTSNDPLMHKRISILLFHSLLRVGRELLQREDPFPFPLLLMHGTADPVCSAKASTMVAERMGPETTLKLWQGWLHELHREPGAIEMQNFVVHWIDKIMGYEHPV